MNPFHYQEQRLFAEKIKIDEIAKTIATPFYLYSKSALEDNWQAFDLPFGSHPHLICFAVKANSNLAVLNTLANLGSGFDIVSGGELSRVLKAGGLAEKVVFSGVGKQQEEMAQALKEKIFCFNIESEAEFYALHEVAAHLNVKAPIALRVNPDVDPQSHPYISTGLKEAKFGIPFEEALSLYQKAKNMPHFHIQGLACHIGSQITSLSPFQEAFSRVFTLIEKLKEQGVTFSHVNLGGGLGVAYQNEEVPTPAEYIQMILKTCKDKMKVVIEPGRAIAAKAGVLVTKVLYLKSTTSKNFCIVDAAMNDFLRPTLYSAKQNIMPVTLRDSPSLEYDVVGPVCESGDCFGKARRLAVEQNDLLALCSTGAYGYVMSSNYNSRPRLAEVMVQAGDFKIVKPKETLSELLRGEILW